MNYAIRITNAYQELASFCEQVAKQSDKVVIYEHDANRVHIHGLLINCKVSTDTIKNYVKRSLGVSSYPKSDWSFKTVHDGKPVDDDFIVYMSKGALQPCFRQGYTIDELELYRSRWVEQPRKRGLVQYKLKVENPQEAKKRQIDMIDEICRRVDQNKYMLSEDIIKVICDVVYVENRTICGRYKIRDYFDMVRYRTQKESFIRQLKNLCTDI